MSEATSVWVCPSCHQPTDPSSNMCEHCRYIHLGRLIAGVAPPPSTGRPEADAPPPPVTPGAGGTAADDGVAAPGWYDDPSGGGERYWDGQQWGEHWLSREAKGGTSPENDGLATIGWITAILIPFVGLVVGIILSSRNDRRGTLIAITAVAVFVAWIAFWVILNAIAVSSAGY
ncbi:MAG: DUF2510 domain-containing protein [Actinobacteria bacterium]|nr:DUF2510 domain-containing protein [Actinomycetota bacterium]